MHKALCGVSYRVDNFTFKWIMEMLKLIVGIFNYRGEWLHFNPCLLWKMMIPSPHHSLPSILIFEWPCNPKLYLMFTSSRSVTIAHHISVIHLVNTACGGIQQVKFGKLDPSAKLQLCNFHTNKFLVRKTCKIKTFIKVDQIIDKTN